MTNLQFSIVIPCLNAERYIDKCLTAIENLNFPKNKYEVILVDNDSTDRTLEIAKKFKIKILSAPRATIPKLRNIGIKHAKGEIIASTDSDCIVDKNWLRNALPYFKDSKIGAVGYNYDAPKDSTFIEKSWAESLKTKRGNVKKLPSGNLLFKKSIWKEINGFDESLIAGSDPEFCYRVIKAGYKIIADPKIKVTHLGFPKTLNQFVKKQYWYGISTLDIALKHGYGIRQFKVSLFAFWSVILLFSFLISTHMYFFSHNYYHPLTFLLLLLTGPVILAFKSTLKSKNKSVFFIYIILYLLYSITRGISIIKSSFINLLKNLSF